MLLNILQYPVQLHSTRNYPANNVNNATIEKFCFKLENDALIFFSSVLEGQTGNCSKRLGIAI